MASRGRAATEERKTFTTETPGAQSEFLESHPSVSSAPLRCVFRKFARGAKAVTYGNA